MKPRHIVIVGGGAAGFFGAIAAARTHTQAKVTLIEATHKPLAKVRISGGGRCNVTHACFEPRGLIQNYPRGGKALIGAFNRFQAKDTVDWFSKRGVKLKTEPDGRMFPVSDRSETIIDCLMKEANSLAVKLITANPVISVEVTATNGFEITLNPRENKSQEKKSQEKLQCNHLLLATGSNPIGYKIAQQLGHTVKKPVPSLFTFNIKDTQLRELAGVSVKLARLRLNVPDNPQLEQTGSLLITHWGLSGPAVLKLSAWGARMLHSHNYQGNLQVNWLPLLKQEEIREQLLSVKSEFPKRLVFSHRGIDLPHRLWQYMVTRAGIPPEKRWIDLPKKMLNKLVQEMTQTEFTVNGKGVFKDEFVTCGGVNLKEIDFKTMESKLIPGLHFAGEILDIDGVTGGFNFQSAWTTGYLAGVAMGS
ncbi:MAG: NAD(P)/FAD-dependent oxidoreductase [Cyanobacteria bacterium P01_A01_bin.68]